MICAKLDICKRDHIVRGVFLITFALILSCGLVCAGWKIPLDGSRSKPVMEQGIIYIGTATGIVYAIDASQGKIIWSFQRKAGADVNPSIIEADKDDINSLLVAARSKTGTGQYKIDASPIIVNGILYIGSRDHSFYAINVKSGQQLWSVKLGEIIDKALVEGENIIVRGGPRLQWWSPRIHVLNMNGGVLWSTAKEQIASHPVPYNGNIYYSLYQPKTEDQFPFFSVYSSQLKTGKLQWVTKLNGKRPHKAVIVEDRIYVTAHLGGEIIDVPGGVSFTPREVHLYAIDVESGKLLWDVKAGKPVTLKTPLTVANNLLYIVTEEGLQAFDQITGNRLWIIRNDFDPYSLHAGRYLYAFKGRLGESDILVALTLKEGKQVWQQSLGSNGSTIEAKAGTLYVTAGKNLFALDLKTGKRTWKFKTGSFFNPGTAITTAPEIYQGQLIFPSMTATFMGKPPIQGYLYSIDLLTGL